MAGSEALVREPEAEGFGGLVGRSPAMRTLFHLLESAAGSDATVLLHGETGTGKEEAARAIHEASSRSAGPFIVVDCSTLTGELLHSELFGHVRGSFTGAVGSRPGAFQAANGGTLFLDEIGEIPIDLQPKLLRSLESRAVKRLGSNELESVDVRVVAATNRDLKLAVGDKTFRSDLYYRLAVIELCLPPLRERMEDLAVLLGRLLDKFGSTMDPAGLTESPTLARLSRYHWPGNVRELRNYVERSLAFGEPAPLPTDEEEAPRSVDITVPLKEARARWVARFERRYIERLLAEHDGYVRTAAEQAGIDRVSLYRLMSRHGVKAGGGHA